MTQVIDDLDVQPDSSTGDPTAENGTPTLEESGEDKRFQEVAKHKQRLEQENAELKAQMSQSQTQMAQMAQAIQQMRQAPANPTPTQVSDRKAKIMASLGNDETGQKLYETIADVIKEEITPMGFVSEAQVQKEVERRITQMSGGMQTAAAIPNYLNDQVGKNVLTQEEASDINAQVADQIRKNPAWGQDPRYGLMIAKNLIADAISEGKVKPFTAKKTTGNPTLNQPGSAKSGTTSKEEHLKGLREMANKWPSLKGKSDAELLKLDGVINTKRRA